MPKIYFFYNKFTKAWRDKIDNTEYLVVPTVAVREMALNGGYLTKEEIAPFANMWDSVPITLGHPVEGSKFVSARSLGQEKNRVGWFFNSTLEGDRLKGEMWLEVNRTPQNVIERLEKGTPTEVSSAYFGDQVVIEGKEHSVNIVPDHIAILINEVGQCSINDGCGAPRVNSKEEGVAMTEELTEVNGLVQNEFTKFVKNLFSNQTEITEADEPEQGVEDESEQDPVAPVVPDIKPEWANDLEQVVVDLSKGLEIVVEKISGIDQRLMANEAKENKPIIDKILANTNVYTRKELEQKVPVELEKIGKLLQVNDYSPLGFSSNRHDEDANWGDAPTLLGGEKDG